MWNETSSAQSLQLDYLRSYVVDEIPAGGYGQDDHEE